MSIRHRFLLSLCSLALCLQGGCEDATARRRAEVQQAIMQAGEKLDEAAVAAELSGEDAQPVRATLQEVVRDLSAVDEDAATAGQKAAKSLLVAAASRSLASLDMAEANRIESELRRERSVIHGRIDAAMRLTGLAAASASVEHDAQRALLQAALADAEAQYAKFASYADQLSDPISAINRENQQYGERARALRQQADQHYRRAAELGAAEGFPSYETAISHKTSADRIEASIARNEVQLGYELQAEHDFAAARMRQYQVMIDAIKSSLTDLDTVARGASAEASDIRQDVSQIAGEISRSLDAVSEQAAGRLNELYEQIASHLDRAAGQARRGASGDTADSARLAGARAHEMAAHAATARAHALADHEAVLQRLIDAGGALGSVQKYQTEVQAVSTKRQAALEQAKTDYEAARDLLGQMSGRGLDATTLDMFRGNLEQQIARLEGRQNAPAPEPAVPGTTSRAPVAVSADAGFASPQEALEALQASEQLDPVATRRILASIHATDPDSVMFRTMMLDIIDPMLDLQTAMIQQFGRDAVIAANAGQSGAMGLTFEGAQLASQDADRAAISFMTPAGQPTQLELINVDGRWLIDADGVMAASGQTGVPAMSGADEQQSLAMAEAVARQLSQVTDDLTERVRAGEFSTPEEVFAAMMQGFLGGLAGPSGG